MCPTTVTVQGTTSAVLCPTTVSVQGTTSAVLCPNTVSVQGTTSAALCPWCRWCDAGILQIVHGNTLCIGACHFDLLAK